MRDLNECRAEVFRRSRERIAERAKIRTRVLAVCVPLCLVIAVSAAVLPSLLGRKPNASEAAPGGNQLAADYVPEASELGTIDSFSFSLTWGCGGISSYDSAAGRLVKESDATHPEDYTAVYRLTDAQKWAIYELIRQLDVTKYPDAYNPHGDGVQSAPTMTLILTVRTDRIQKTIAARDIALLYSSADPAGQKFLSTCKAIEDILTAADAWKALPEYEFYYD